MPISRRSFARSVIAALAGATAVRQVVAAPATITEEICKVYDVSVEMVAGHGSLDRHGLRRIRDELQKEKLRSLWGHMHRGCQNQTQLLPEGWAMVQYCRYEPVRVTPTVTYWTS